MSLLDYILLLAVVYLGVLAMMLWFDAAKSRKRAVLGEGRYGQLFEEIPLACLETDAAGNIRRVNRKMCDLHGLEGPEILGRHYSELSAELDRDRVREEIGRKLAGETPLVPQKQTYMHRDGGMVTAQIFETLLHDARGAVTGLRISALDVTEHIQKEEEIWQTTAELRAIFQALPDMFLRLDLDGVILDYRGPSSPLFLRSQTDLVGRRLTSLLPQEVGAQIERAVARVRKTNAVVAIEYSIPTDTDDLFFEARLIPLHWKEVIVIVRDITERKRAEKRLELYAEEVQEKNDDLAAALATAREATLMKGRFLANMSHEIRTPMNGVLGMTDLLLDTPLNAEQQEYAEAVKQSAGALLTITNDILDLSKIEAGRLTIECIPFDIATVVRETMAWFAVRARAKGLQLAADLPDAIPQDVRGDPMRLRQILTNLVGNAIKFTDNGGITVRVHVDEARPGTAAVRFEVEDTGIGSPAEQRGRLFESFTQGDSSTTRKYGGTGLGLAISKQLVELLGGEIGVDSERGRGSTFWFTAVFDRSGAEARGGDAQDETGLRGMRVLVAAGAGSETLWSSLQRLGCATGAISSGGAVVPELWAAAQKGTPYHAVLLDIDLPGVDTSIGIEVAEDPIVYNTALLAMTSNPKPVVDAKLRERGFRACLAKPVSRMELHHALGDVWRNEAAGGAQFPFLREEPAASEPRQQPETDRPPRVLLAEDNLVNQTIVLRLLEKAGLKADVVNNGLQAVQAAMRNSYDLILMDCQMPEMDGFEATAEIRRMEGDRKHTTICALTAHAMAGDRERCLAAGMDDYISKPLTIGVLHNKIAYWIFSKQKHAQTA
jgi:two-component system, sensor histidine kinase and response regulator